MIAEKSIELHHAKRNHVGHGDLHEDQKTKELKDVLLRCGRILFVADTVGANLRSMEVPMALVASQRT